MAEYNTPDIYPNLNNQEFRLNRISVLRNYFTGEIRERELMNKRLNKYIVFLIILINL